MTCHIRPTRTTPRTRWTLLLAALLLLAATPALAAPSAPAASGTALGGTPFSLAVLADAVRTAVGDALASLWLPSGAGMDPDGSPSSNSGGAMDPDGGPSGESGGTMDPDGLPLGG